MPEFRDERAALSVTTSFAEFAHVHGYQGESSGSQLTVEVRGLLGNHHMLAVAHGVQGETLGIGDTEALTESRSRPLRKARDAVEKASGTKTLVRSSRMASAVSTWC